MGKAGVKHRHSQHFKEYKTVKLKLNETKRNRIALQLRDEIIKLVSEKYKNKNLFMVTKICF